MAVSIEEAYDREADYPEFPPLQDWVPWRTPGVWWFNLEAITQFGTIRHFRWAIQRKPGAAYSEVRQAVRRRAAKDRIRKVTLYRRDLPMTRETIAFIDSQNRKLLKAKEERRRVQDTHS